MNTQIWKHSHTCTHTSDLLKASLFWAEGSYLKHHFLVLQMHQCHPFQLCIRVCVCGVFEWTYPVSYLMLWSYHSCNAAAEPVNICLDGEGELSCWWSACYSKQKRKMKVLYCDDVTTYYQISQVKIRDAETGHYCCSNSDLKHEFRFHFFMLHHCRNEATEQPKTGVPFHFQ